ncbi:MAG: YbaK/EbsC family protein [Patescibacteria group bacterium]
MEDRFGAFTVLPAKDHPELMAAPVFSLLSSLPDAGWVGVTEIDPSLSDTVAFCERYGVGVELAANCVVLEAKRAEKTWFAACVILGSTRIDVNGVARKTLDARKASFAPMERAVLETGMEYGAITPVGLPPSWPILVDASVAAAERVIVGSGIRKSKLIIPGSLLVTLRGASVLAQLAKRA